jgi:hypothetical protein
MKSKLSSIDKHLTTFFFALVIIYEVVIVFIACSRSLAN